jgi:rubrerythrin
MKHNWKVKIQDGDFTVYQCKNCPAEKVVFASGYIIPAKIGDNKVPFCKPNK